MHHCCLKPSHAVVRVAVVGDGGADRIGVVGSGLVVFSTAAAAAATDAVARVGIKRASHLTVTSPAPPAAV